MKPAKSETMDIRDQTGNGGSEHPVDALAAFALDALPRAEREAVLAHLAQCATCREQVARYREVSDVLPLGEPPESPSPDLRQRILDRATRVPRAEPRPTASGGARRAFGWTSPAGWLVAAALFLVSLGLGAWNYSLQQQVRALQVAQPVSVALAATADAPGATGQVALGVAGRNVLAVRDLPPPPTGQVYEAWVIGTIGPRPAGTFMTTPDGHGAVELTQAPRAGETVAVTNEPAPGGATPSGKIVLKGTV